MKEYDQPAENEPLTATPFKDCNTLAVQKFWHGKGSFSQQGFVIVYGLA
jgi:hypothetical protein